MTCPVQVMSTREKLGRIAKILNDEPAHNGFPVVEDYDPDMQEKVRSQSLAKLRFGPASPAT